MIPQLYWRRTFLSWLSFSASMMVLPGPAYAALSQRDLETFDPFGPKQDYFNILRPVLFDIEKGKPYLDALWRMYKQTGERWHGERALIGMFLLWRAIPSMKERVRFARAGQKMADIVANAHPEHPSGHVWGAIFFGSEALAAGVLDSVHLAPAIEQRLRRAAALDDSYMYGLGHLVRAKLFIKAPPFPVSVGGFDKGYRALAKAAEYCKGVFAGYYIILAEAEYLTKNKEAAFAVLERMQQEVKTSNVAEAYALDSMTYDAQLFRDAINNGEYSKYFWDTFLMLSKPGLP